MKIDNDYKNVIGDHIPLTIIEYNDILHNKAIDKMYYRMISFRKDKTYRHHEFYTDEDNLGLRRNCVDLIKRKVYSYEIKNL